MQPITSGVESLQSVLEDWAAKSGVGGKPRTQKYQREIVAMIRRHWPQSIGRPAREITEAEVTEWVGFNTVEPDDLEAVRPYWPGVDRVSALRMGQFLAFNRTSGAELNGRLW